MGDDYFWPCNATAFNPRDAHVLGNHLIVVGDLRKMSDLDNDFEVLGPFSESDPSGTLGTTLVKNFTYDSIEVEGDINAEACGNDIGITVIDIRTGEPIEALQMNNAFGNALINSVGAAQTNNGQDIVSLGGRFIGQIHLNPTNTCSPVSDTVSGTTSRGLFRWNPSNFFVSPRSRLLGR